MKNKRPNSKGKVSIVIITLLGTFLLGLVLFFFIWRGDFFPELLKRKTVETTTGETEEVSTQATVATEETETKTGEKTAEKTEEQTEEKTEKETEEEKEAISAEETAFVNQLLTWARDSMDNIQMIGSDYWGVVYDEGVFKCLREFAIGDFDADGKQELAVWEEVYHGEFFRTELASSWVTIYEYSGGTVEEKETVDGASKDTAFSKKDTPNFYKCQDGELKKYCQDRSIQVPAELEELVGKTKVTFDDDRKRYKALLDDMKAELESGSGEDEEVPNYSMELEKKWGGGKYTRWYAFLDLDGDGARELVLFTDENGHYAVSAIYTCRNGKIEHILDAGVDWHSIFSEVCLLWDGHIVTTFFDTAIGSGGESICRLKDGVLTEEFGYVEEGGVYYRTRGDFRSDCREEDRLSKAEVDEKMADTRTDGPWVTLCDMNEY